MESRYPEHISGYDIEHMEQLYDKIYLADCQWNTSFDSHHIVQEQVHSTRPRRSSVHHKGRVIEPEVTYFSMAKANITSDNASMHLDTHHEYYAHTHSIWEEIAHGLHKASITILGILVIEVIKNLLNHLRFTRSSLCNPPAQLSPQNDKASITHHFWHMFCLVL